MKLFRVLLLLLTLAACTNEADRQYYAGLMAEADSLNRHYISFTTDSVMKDAVSFYDRHGSANERMHAHYLLGCVYRDLGEAPQALQCYQDAVECADTTSSDCNYQVLMAVYGQMAELYHTQNLPLDEIEARNKYGYYALLSNDTLKYIRNFQLNVKPYYLLGDTIKVLEVLDIARKLYLKHGYKQEAAGTYATQIYIMVQRGQLEEARRMVNTFEHESGLFDEEGNIRKDRNGYYYTRDLYCIVNHDLDSAEMYMRKLKTSALYADAYRGLLQVYRERNNADSVFKYSTLYESALDSANNKLRTQTIHQMTSLYNYQRYRDIAKTEQAKALTTRILLVAICLVLFFLTLVCISFAWAYRQGRLRKLRDLASSLANVTEKYDDAQAELETMKQESAARQREEEIIHDSNSDLEKQKEENEKELLLKQNEIEKLRETLSHYMEQLQKIRPTTKISDDLPIIIYFKEKAAGHRRKSSLGKTHWRELTELFISAKPRTYAYIAREGLLSPQELKTCLLTTLGFTNGEIANVLDTSPQTITNCKQSANKKLFSQTTATTLQRKLKEYENFSAIR